MRWIAVAASAVALAVACDQPVEASGASSSATDSVAGLTWSVPDAWSRGNERPMRVATYSLPGKEGVGECAVFHFPGTGGSVDANVTRWVRQFEGSPQPTRTTREVAGLSVTVVELAGTYLAPGGPMMKSTGTNPGYRLFGAIVAAPGGNVFFKVTGPASTVEAHRPALESLVASVRRS